MNSHSHFFHFFKNRELNEMYVSLSVRAFALSLIGIFIPIFFYSKGYVLATIFIFYSIQSVAHIVFSIPAAKISSRFGVKHSMLLSIPFLILFLMLLYSLEQFQWPLSVLAIFAGMSTALFWIPYHIDFAKFSDRKNRGKEIGVSGIMASIFSTIGPAVGGIFLVLFGFKALFLIVSVLLFISIFPLFLSEEFHETSSFSFKDFFKGQKKKDVVSFLGHGIENKMNGIVWPLFIFIFIFNKNYTYLGLASSLMMSIAFFSTIFVSEFSDKYRKSVLKIGSISNAVVWFARSFIIHPIQVFFTEAFYGFSHVAMHIPFDAMNYDKANKKNRMTAMILQREIYHHVGVIILFLTLAVLTQYIPEAFRYGGPLSSLMRLFF